MYNTIIDQPNNCYGCGACVEVCPQRCLGYEKNELGFRTIKVIEPEKCISFGLCTKVCQVYKNSSSEIKYIKRYYAQHKKDEVLQRSSSGGVFTALAQTVLNSNGVVWGVKINGNGDTQFICVSDGEQLKELCGSKYVETEKPLPYKEIECQLKEGIKVLVSGTPCQIKGLKTYLRGKDYPNLCLVDLLCYGIQSPVVWKEYLKEKNPQNKKIKKLCMRYKKPGWENYAIKVEYEDGKSYIKSRWKDPYLLSYATNLYNRESCAQCTAKCFPRESDITIGDFWQIDSLPNIPEGLKINKGVSLIITNTVIGEKILKEASVDLVQGELPDNIFQNMVNRLSEFSKLNPNKTKFMKDIYNKGFSLSIKEIIKPSYKEWGRLHWLQIKRILKKMKKS